MTKQHIEPRSLALGCVELVLEKGRDIQEVLDAQLSHARTKGLDPRDAGLATELAYGYLRLKSRVDYVAQGFLRKPKGVPPGLLTLLGFATYALQYLERVPAYATVDWAVTSAGRRFGKNLSRLANAVLRKIADLGDDAKEPQFYRKKDDTEVAFLSRYWTCPQWVINVWLEHYGQEQTNYYLAAQDSTALAWVAVATAVIQAFGNYSGCSTSIQTASRCWSPGSPSAQERMYRTYPGYWSRARSPDRALPPCRRPHVPGIAHYRHALGSLPPGTEARPAPCWRQPTWR